jgi:aspartyl protease family protein
MSSRDDREEAGPWGRPEKARSRFGWRLFVLAGILLAGLVALLQSFPPRVWRDGEQISFVNYGVIAMVMLMSVAASRKSLLTIARELAIWAMLAILLVGAYGYRYELGELWQRTLAEFLPARGVQSAGGTMTFGRSPDRQFWIDATADGRPIRFLVDTGASSVVLSREDAVRLGFSLASLSYTQIFQTENGTTRGAPVRLREIRIGALRFEDVPAFVNEGELGQSLLGMHLLERLSSLEIRNDKLILRQ